MGLQLGQEPQLLALVDRLDRIENGELVVLFGREPQHGLHVLWKAAAAVADPGEQK